MEFKKKELEKENRSGLMASGG
jgi:hypothetical protein